MSDIQIYNQPNCILPKSFFEGRFITESHPDSLDYAQWWQEQIRRCIEGWSDGGYTVPGVYYYHLNFRRINMLDKNNKPFLGNPYFSLDDMDLFKEMTQARAEGKGFLLVTGRGFGKSLDVGAFAEHEFTFVPASEIIVSASTDFFAKELWSKIGIGLNYVPDELKPNLLSNTKDYRESGVKVKSATGKDTVIGYRSKMHRVVYDNDAGKTRGTRPNIHIFEEGGSWSGAAKLVDCYNQTEASWWRGSVYTSFPIIIGTGGQMKQGGSEDFKMMFEDPDAFNLKAFKWEDQRVGKFIPAYVKFGGHYEDSGVSNPDTAKEFLDKRRESKKKNTKTFQQEMQEFPFTPEEAFMTSGFSIFDVNLLFNRYAEIKKSKELSAKVERCDLQFVRSGSRIIGVKKVLDPKGPFEILEHPEMGKDGALMKGLYVSGCDSFDAVEEEEAEDTTKSKGSMFIYKRFWRPDKVGNIFVAKITQRTNNASKFYWNTVKLNMYYGCKMLYEHTKIGIAQHYITNRLSHLLYPRPKLDSVTFKSSKSTNMFGIAMPVQVKQVIINKYSEYIDNNIDQMYFESQIYDAMNFRFKSSKFDETMAASIALLADADMYDIAVKESKAANRVFPKFQRDANGELVFK